MSGRFLDRIALGRPELRAWALYDWANSAFFTVIVTAVFPIFYAQVVAAGLEPAMRRESFALATTWSLLIAAIAAPLLGALADVSARKKLFLSGFMLLGALATAGMFLLGPGDVRLAQWLFGIANFGAAGSFVFYDALLVHVARDEERDQLSSSAYALGYLGGGLALLLCVLLIRHPVGGMDTATATQAGFVLVALWWGVFSLPLILSVPEPPRQMEADEQAGMSVFVRSFTRMGETFRELRHWKAAFLMMLAFLIYNDGIGTIIRMAVTFGEEKAIPAETMLAVILTVQFVGIPFSILFGRLAGRIGAKRAILLALAVYVGIAIYAAQMNSQREFWIMALAVGAVQGGAQSLSRSLFARLVPAHKAGEFFGLFATLEKFAGVLGPYLFVVFPTSEGAILALIAFFVIGAAILARVDVETGARLAREAEQGVRSDGSLN